MSTKYSLPSTRGFTLIEMMLSITVFSVIIVMAFQSLGNIGILRSKVSSKLDMNTELYFSVERLVSLMKNGGDIDYEEYWNRQTVGTATMSGHYQNFTGFGNYGSGANFAIGSESYGDDLSYCRSDSGATMGTLGCLAGFNTYDAPLLWIPERYGAYRLQFIDYNSNASSDNGRPGDEDGDGNIRGDDDDEDLGAGPRAFIGWVAMKELYLIKTGAKPERLFFRWNIKQDPHAPTGVTCDFTNATGSGCLGNIQILRLVGRDLGIEHSSTVNSARKYDGTIDTWECRSDFNCLGKNNLPSGSDTEWVDIFPDYIHVKNVSFFVYPDKDFRYSWKEDDSSQTINSYVRLNITLGLSWEKRRQIKTGAQEATISTTVNLSK